MTLQAHERKLGQLAAALAAARAGTPERAAAWVGLGKSTSNLFRDRRPARPRVDLRGFDEVIAIDPDRGLVDAEGMTRYDALVEATLAQSAMPLVVPQLRSITLGGALAGVGIEASSFRHGLVHETVEAFDVVTGDGRIVHCTPDGEHRDLFVGFPNSYGTLGYALRLRARTQPVRPYVALEHRRCDGAEQGFAELAALAAGSPQQAPDFLEGVAFGPDEIVLTLGRFVDRAPYVSDYGLERIYWRSIREHDHDYLPTREFLWRWDTDWFWCSRQLGAQHPLVRRLLGRRRLNSLTYQRVMRWNSRWGFTRAWQRLRGLHGESVIQDVQIPAPHAAEFLRFLAREIGIWPVWLCPIRAAPTVPRWPLFALAPGVMHVNFGFWDVIRGREAHPPGHFNRLVEAQVAALGGRKSLYSESWYTPEAFWAGHDHEAYRALKARYDPAGTLGDLYAKCCRRA
jgi:FAD/FMN-containing dehydrogenase